jgi:predicted NAD/FAD-dependent oxidoreductase
MKAHPLRIAIVGAGISGLACAARLQSLGGAVTVFEKSADIGGRLAARRRGGGIWHHGAPAVEARDPAFTRFLIAQAEAGRARIVTESEDALIAQGAPDMRELTRGLATGLETHFDVEVATPTRTADGWAIDDTKQRSFGPFDVVLSAIPAPQLEALLERSGLAVPQPLRGVRMMPRWTFLVGFESQPPGWVPDDENVAGLVAMTPRPRADLSHCFVLHASDSWSLRHLECSREEAVELIRRYLAVCPESRKWLAQAARMSGHRWRYALTSRPLGSAYLYEPAIALGHTGDWCTGATAEAGYLNGLRLADAVMSESVRVAPHA